MAHGETWKFDGGEVVSVPFYGEDPCDLELPRNCYLIADRGNNILVHADSGPTNSGKSPLNDGILTNLVDALWPLFHCVGLAATAQRSPQLYGPCLFSSSWDLVGGGGEWVFNE